MAKVMVNGVEVEMTGVTVEKLSTEAPQGSFGKIKGAIEALLEGNGGKAYIVDLEDALHGLFPEIAEGQCRQRVNNFVSNSKGKWVKVWGPEHKLGRRIVIRANLLPKKEEEVEEKKGKGKK